MVYVDERGRRGYVRPGQITGPWQAHEAALARAEATRQTLRTAAGDRILTAGLAYRTNGTAVTEHDRLAITIQLTAEQANRLADPLRERTDSDPGA